MTEVKSPWGSMGRVHKGFWKAMGEPTFRRTNSIDEGSSSPPRDHNSMTPEIATQTNGPILRIELINTSVYRTIVSAIQGLGKIIQFVTFNLFHHVKEPIDSSWMGPDTDIRSNSMYAQAEQHILDLIHRQQLSDEKQNRRRSGLSHGSTVPTAPPLKKKKRLFITGHSLGGAMGTSKLLTINYLYMSVVRLTQLAKSLFGKNASIKKPSTRSFCWIIYIRSA